MITPRMGSSHSELTGPLTAINVGLVLAAVPLYSQVSIAALLLLVGSAVARSVGQASNRWRVPPLPVKLLILAGGLAVIFMQFGSLSGIEPGLSVLLTLVALKLLEENSQRDLRVVALLGLFLALCVLFFAQDLARWLYVGTVLLGLFTGLTRSHLSRQKRALWAATRMSATIFLQALPLVLILFLFFPRISGGFRFQFGRSTQAGIGMDDRLQPGSIAALAQCDDIAFSASFPDGNPPPQAEMYWRGVVLWRGDGLTWVRGNSPSSERRTPLGGSAVRQRIVLQPHGARWMFALDRPAMIPPRATLESGGFLQSLRPIFYPISYEVLSSRESPRGPLPGDQRSESLRKPGHVSAQVAQLAASFRAGAGDDNQVAARALEFFQNGKFVYTLTPGTYSQNELDEFLFQRRSGFCEHYAAAFATLMRIAGVPSRVVIGYHGGQFNRHGNYVMVRQADAHSWCEIWTATTGWKRVDPTSVIAPDRINAGFESFLDSTNPEAGAGGGGSTASGGWRSALKDAKLLWDSLAYRWDLWILNFDEEEQRSFLMNMGLAAWESSSLVAGIVIVSAGLVGALGLWLRRSVTLPQDRAVVLYNEFCRGLAALGTRRAPAEGPEQFVRRAATELPALADKIRTAGRLYVGIRYSPCPPSADEFAAAVRDVEHQVAGVKRTKRSKGLAN